MIDFRYHLVSIVAVFLALGIGVLMGSAVLGENLVESLRGDLEGISARNAELREETTELRNRLEANEEFAQVARPALVEGALTGERIVLINIDGTDGDLLGATAEVVEEAGGTVDATITVLDRLVFEGEAEIDRLALLLGTSLSEPADLRRELGRQLGTVLADAASISTSDSGEPRGQAAQRRAEEFLSALEEEGFVDIDATESSSLIPGGAAFAFLTGGEGDPPFPLGELMNALTITMAEQGTAVMVSEGVGSTWRSLDVLRTDPEAEAAVTTVSQFDEATGQIAVALALAEVIDGIGGRHYGVGSGTEGIIPQPPAGS